MTKLSIAGFERLEAGPKGEAHNVPRKKRSLYVINEYFEPVFNAVATTQIVIQ